MGAGEDIAAAKATVAGILKKSVHSLSLCYDQTPETDGNYDRNQTGIRRTLANIGQACTVSGASFQRMQSNPKVQAGDKVFKVPGTLVTETQLKTENAYLVYGDETLELIQASPLKVSFGVVIEWEIIGRTKAFN